MLRARRARSWAFSVAATVLVAVIASSDAAAILAVTPSLLLAVVLLLRIDEKPNWFLVALTSVVGFATLLWAAMTGANPTGSMALGVAIGVIIEAKTIRKTAWAAAAAVAVALVSAVAFVTGSPNALGIVLQLTFVAGIWLSSILDMGSERRLFTLLEKTKDVERELSITQERHRFAADLHDIQGHTLHVIKLKAAVAAKLRTTDPERTAQELDAIQQLTAETIAAARELAADQHTLGFSDELRSSVDLLDAAGATTTVHRPDGTPAPAYDATLARVLREATTNLLRHSHPKQVSVHVGRDRVTVTNDGAPELNEPPTLRGLEKLRQRLRANDGELELQHAGGTFTITARLTETRDC